MSVLTLAYNTTLSCVTCTGTSLDPSASVALFESSTDQIHWTTVRGGSAVTISSATATVNDYEFAPGVTNYYRISTINVNAPTFVAAGTPATSVGVALTPALPGGFVEGDLLVVWSAIRNSGTGTVVCPTGYTVMVQTDNVGLFGRRAGPAGTETVPTVGVTGGVTGSSGSDVIAQMAAFHNCERTPAAIAGPQLDPAALNIAYPGLSAVQSNWAVSLWLGWNQDDWTSVATVTGATQIGSPTSTAGADAGLVWDYQLMSSPTAVPSGSFVVSGSTSVISYGSTVVLRSADYVTRTMNTITPAMNVVWLKFPSAPYCNTVVTLTDWAEVDQTSRSGTFAVVGKRYATAVTDLFSPRTVTVSLYAQGLAEIADLDLVLSLGSVVLLHVPSVCQLASMYAVVGNYSYMRPSARSVNATFTVPLTEVAAPDGSIVGSTVTYATLVNQCGSYQSLLSANASYTAVLALVGSPSDALVGT